MKRVLSLFFSALCISSGLIGCGAMHDYYNMAAAQKLAVVDADPTDPADPVTPETPVTPAPLFSFGLGNSVSPVALADHSLINDYDGDGIPNSQENTTNLFVAEYPKIVTRIDTPISVDIRSNSTSASENFSETISGSETKDTLSNSMESKQYNQANRKTTPYVSKEAYSDSVSKSSSYGRSNSSSNAGSNKVAGSITLPECKTAAGSTGGGGASWDFESSYSNAQSSSDNGSIADSFAKSKSAETTNFKDVEYVDNLSRNGVEINNNKIQTMTSSYRSSDAAKNTKTIGPNAGVVSSCLYMQNLSVNFPVRVANVKCTLSFRTPSGQCQAVKTFFLRNDDYSQFAENIYGSEEKGPYAIVIDGLNTSFIRKALANGWVPQIHVLSYETSLVKDSNYNPGVENLRIVEEAAKGRTSLICIKGQGIKESYRVSAFDLQGANFVPGISLKKALYNIMADRIGSGEKWESDSNGSCLTVEDKNLKWMKCAPDRRENTYSSNREGNSWRSFETYVKYYTDDTGKSCKIETIKRLFALKKYNPFDPRDNSRYNPSELLSNSELEQMQYWVIYHNGKYFEGDINDPIWPGERYELVCVNVKDFNQHFQDYYYTPLQSMESFILNTRWNALTDQNPDFARAVYLGQVVQGDSIHLTVSLDETRDLFYIKDRNQPLTIGSSNGQIPNYTFASESVVPAGIPKSFSHLAKGGINNFVVSIDPSENAQNYDICIAGVSDPSYIKKITVDYTTLSKNGNLVFINRFSQCGDGVLGPIPGGPKGFEKKYKVSVLARSIAYGSEVSILSSSNADNANITVSNPVQKPGAFSMTADGVNDQIVVCIGNSTDAEYFDTTITGPLNKSVTGAAVDGYTCVEKTYKFHSGYNCRKLASVPPQDKIVQPGIYHIKVTARNQNCTNSSEAVGEMDISVPYDRYLSQKSADTTPAVSTSLESLGAVDLEVNFNDGTGWYILQTSGIDSDLGNKKAIDCRFTSHADYRDRKFNIYFAPPSGTSGRCDNIFSGGRQIADLFIRTRAKAEYRDTLWPKKNTPACFVANTGLNGWDLIWNVINGTAFDATNIENQGGYTTFANGVPLRIDNAAKGDLFFSPWKERSYSVFAEIVPALPPSAATPPSDPRDLPTIAIISPLNRGVFVKKIEASDNTLDMKVFYKGGTTGSIAEDIPHTWLVGPDVKNNGDANGNFVSISNLEKNKPYMVAVFATAKGQLSKNAVIRGPVTPFGDVSQSKPSLVVTPQSINRKNIVVSSLYIPGESRYQIFYKANNVGADSDAASWKCIDTFDLFGGKQCTDPVSITIADLNYSTHYKVKARAVEYNYVFGMSNESLQGAVSDVYEVKTLNDPGAAPFPPADVTLSISGDGKTVFLNNVYSHNATHYKITCICSGGPSTKSPREKYARAIPETVMSIPFDVANFAPGNSYAFTVRGVNWLDDDGITVSPSNENFVIGDGSTPLSWTQSGTVPQIQFDYQPGFTWVRSETTAEGSTTNYYAYFNLSVNKWPEGFANAENPSATIVYSGMFGGAVFRPLVLGLNSFLYKYTTGWDWETTTYSMTSYGFSNLSYNHYGELITTYYNSYAPPAFSY